MFKQVNIYEKQCASCKMITGLLLTGIALFHTNHIKFTWPYLNASSRFLNVLGGGATYLFGFGSFVRAYNIKMGQEMQLI